MRVRSILWLAIVVAFGAVCGRDVRSELPDKDLPQAAASEEKPQATGKQKENSGKRAGKNVVLWISVDGFRGDYVDRDVTPFLESLMRHGVYTRKLTPVFPSLTFPSHVSEATGVLPGVHGIVSNKYFDTATGQEYNFPGDPNFLQAEPIWLTAARQGVRTAVLDWPLSQGEEKLPEATIRAAYFNPKYDPDLTDAERIGKLVEAYRADSADSKHPEPLRLLMGYVHDVDSAGHKAGPDAIDTKEAIQKTDRLLRNIVEETAAIFKQRTQSERGDALYVLITTDHGMAPVTTLVNLRTLIGGTDVPKSVIALYSGSVAQIYLSKVPSSDRDRIKNAIVTRLREARFVKFWLRDELPPKWGYANPTRTGDIVVSLDAGYDFTHRGQQTVAPIESDPKPLKGMHGYDPAEVSEMFGFMVLCRYGAEQSGHDLGQLDSLRIHPTVAKLLDIQPAERATASPIDPLP